MRRCVVTVGRREAQSETPLGKREENDVRIIERVEVS